MSKRWLMCLLASLVCAGLIASAAEEKKSEKKAEKKEEKKKEEKKPVTVPEVVSKALKECCKECPECAVLACKEKKDGDKVVCYEVKMEAKDGQKCKVVVGADGKILEASKCKISSAKLPAAVADAVKKWAPAGKLCETATVETKKDSGTCYQVEAEVAGKKVKAEIGADGKLIKGDKMPEPKAEKKEEKKKEEKKKEEKK